MQLMRGMPWWVWVMIIPFFAVGSLPIAALTSQAMHLPLWLPWLAWWCLMVGGAEIMVRMLDLPKL